MHGVRGLGAAALIMLLYSGAACADAKQDLIASFQKMMAKGRYTAQMVTEVKGRSYPSQLEVVLPDRFHVRSQDSEAVILPEGTWMQVGGQWMKMPINMTQMIRGYTREAMEKGMASIEDVQLVGSEKVGGCTADLYRYRSSGEYMGFKNTGSLVAAVCRDTGLPVRLVYEGTRNEKVTVLYDYSREVVIRPPAG